LIVNFAPFGAGYCFWIDFSNRRGVDVFDFINGQEGAEIVDFLVVFKSGFFERNLMELFDQGFVLVGGGLGG